MKTLKVKIGRKREKRKSCSGVKEMEDVFKNVALMSNVVVDLCGCIKRTNPKCVIETSSSTFAQSTCGIP
jgi:hypothetical protein